MSPRVRATCLSSHRRRHCSRRNMLCPARCWTFSSAEPSRSIRAVLSRFGACRQHNILTCFPAFRSARQEARLPALRSALDMCFAKRAEDEAGGRTSGSVQFVLATMPPLPPGTDPEQSAGQPSAKVKRVVTEPRRRARIGEKTTGGITPPVSAAVPGGPGPGPR